MAAPVAKAAKVSNLERTNKRQQNEITMLSSEKLEVESKLLASQKNSKKVKKESKVNGETLAKQSKTHELKSQASEEKVARLLSSEQTTRSAIKNTIDKNDIESKAKLRERVEDEPIMCWKRSGGHGKLNTQSCRMSCPKLGLLQFPKKTERSHL